MPTHSSILAWKNPMDRRAWQAALHGVPKIQTRFSGWTTAATQQSFSCGQNDDSGTWMSDIPKRSLKDVGLRHQGPGTHPPSANCLSWTFPPTSPPPRRRPQLFFLARECESWTLTASQSQNSVQVTHQGVTQGWHPGVQRAPLADGEFMSPGWHWASLGDFRSV